MSPSAKRVVRVDQERQPYRTELTPVSFLRRSAYVFPDKDRGDPRGAAVHLPPVRGAGEPAGLAPARARAPPTRPRGLHLPRTPRRCWRRTTACPRPAAPGRRSTRGSTRTRSATSSEHSGAKVPLRRRRVRAARRSRSTSGRAPRRAHRRHRRPRRSLRGLPGRRLARRPSSPGSRTRTRRSRSTTPRARPGGPRASWYHHRGRLPERHRRDDRDRHVASTRATSGRCRCSTATAGASPGRSPRSAAPTSASGGSSRAGSGT